MNPTANVTERVSTDQLRTGDIVLNYGMRIRLGALTTYTDSYYDRTVYHFAGTVENIDAIREQDTADRADGLINGGSGFIAALCDGPNRDQWSVQGNELAHWVRVVR